MCVLVGECNPTLCPIPASRYTTRVPAPPPSSRGTALADAAGTTPMTLTLNGRRANAYTVFVNGALVGNVWDAAHSWGPKAFTIPLKLSAAATADAGLSWDLAILSTSIGMMSHVTKSGLEAKVRLLRLGAGLLGTSQWPGLG